MKRRRKSREVVLQVLYEDDMNPDRNLVSSDKFLRRRLGQDPEAIEFANELLSGVRRSRAELDALLRRLAENWSLERMAVTDRNILRLGAYELLYSETPGAVIIDEAVELAKRFGAKNSAQFVNGILDRALQERKRESPESSGSERDL